MSTEPEKPSRMTEPPLIVVPAIEREDEARSRDDITAGRVEIQLRARVEQLEAALGDAGRCLEDAEHRAAELLASRARTEDLERKLAVIVASRSWRLAAPLRNEMQRARRLLRR